MAGKSDFLEDEILNRFLRNTTAYTPSGTVYVGLMTASGTDAAQGTEVADANGYARTAVTFGAASGGAVANNADVTFPTASGGTWGTVVEFAIFDTATYSGGNMLYFGPINPPKAIGDGDTAKFLTGDIDITED